MDSPHRYVSHESLPSHSTGRFFRGRLQRLNILRFAPRPRYWQRVGELYCQRPGLRNKTKRAHSVLCNPSEISAGCRRPFALIWQDCPERRFGPMSEWPSHLSNTRVSAQLRESSAQKITINRSYYLLLSNRAGTLVHASTRRSTLCGAVVLHRPQRCRSRSYLCDSRAYLLFLRTPDAIGLRSVRSQLRSSITLFTRCFGPPRASSGLKSTPLANCRLNGRDTPFFCLETYLVGNTRLASAAPDPEFDFLRRVHNE